MSVVTKSLERSQMVVTNAKRALIEKGPQITGAISSDAGMAGFSNSWQKSAANKERYSLFRGVMYAAVNVLASEAAGQSVQITRQKGKENEGKPTNKKGGYTAVDKTEIEILDSHPLLTVMENPNPIQNKWQFVYSFITNLNLTGWAYVISDVNKDGRMELYSLPSTWVTPIHTKSPFFEFDIRNPKRPEVEAVRLTQKNVGFAYLPDPSDPLSSTAPASSQMNAIRVDDYIWASRNQFFKNGIFPGSIVTIGKDPHPDVPAGVRPRLDPAQRRAVNASIKKVLSGVANYGNPAVVDGMIEKIERLSMESNEMGWEKSEQSTKTAILSAFCVHPYLLGEAVSVGGYAQVANIEKRFYKRVNTLLSMLSATVTNFVGSNEDEDVENVKVEFKECVVVDPQIDWANYKFAKTNNVISQNEFRAKLGLGPDPDHNEEVINRQLLTPLVQLLDKKAAGSITKEQVQGILIGMGFPDDLAEQVAGDDVEPPEPPPVMQPMQLPPGTVAEEDGQQIMAGKPKPKVKPKKEEDEKSHVDILRDAILVLKSSQQAESDKLVKLLS